MHLYLDKWSNGSDFGERTTTQIRKREGQKVDGEVTFIWCTETRLFDLQLPCSWAFFMDVLTTYLSYVETGEGIRVPLVGWKPQSSSPNPNVFYFRSLDTYIVDWILWMDDRFDVTHQSSHRHPSQSLHF